MAPPFDKTVQCYWRIPKFFVYCLELAVFVTLGISGVKGINNRSCDILKLVLEFSQDPCQLFSICREPYIMSFLFGLSESEFLLRFFIVCVHDAHT